MEACGQYDDDEYDCRANFYIGQMNVSATNFDQSLNITVFYDKEIECDEFVSHFSCNLPVPFINYQVSSGLYAP